MKKNYLWALCFGFIAFAGCSSDSAVNFCDETTKPDSICKCVNNAWNCDDDECSEDCVYGCNEDGSCKEKPIECDEACPDNCNEDGSCKEKPAECDAECPNDCNEDGSCKDLSDDCPEECEYGCDENGSCKEKPAECDAECPNDCNEDGSCKEKPLICPDECPDECDTEGNCRESDCPSECPNDCTDHICNSHAPECPDECQDNCDDDGKCEPICPTACPNNCDSNGNCPCPDTCKTSCDANGVCKCPSACEKTCTENGECPAPECPAACPGKCDSKGVCPCPSTCKSSCNTNGVCQCPSTCKSSCNTNGVCQCPSTCKSSCDANGVCQCPSTCKTSCDANGVCKCPSTCANTCNANGECPVMCGKETVTKMYFLFPETDLLPPGAKARQAVTAQLYIKTKESSKAYTSTTAPCKSEIKLKSSNTKIMTVTQGESTPTFKPVSTGTATGTATIGSQTGMKASITVHVLDPDVMKENIALKESGNLKHLFKVFELKRNRVTQGFDFYDYNKIFFTMIAIGGTIKGTTTKFDRRAVLVYEVDQATGETIGDATYIYDAGHGQGLSIEHATDGDYIWIGNYGSFNTQKPEDGYSSSQTLCRVPLVHGKSYKKTDIEHYYYDEPGTKGYAGLEPGLDVKNNRFVFRGKKDGKTYIKIYYLSEVKKLKADKEVTLARPINYLDDSFALHENDNKVTLKVKDLHKLTPIHEFYKTSSTDFLDQGFTFENGIVYAVGGVPSTLEKPVGNYKYQSSAQVKLFSQTGTELYNYYLQPCDANGIFKTSSLDALVNKKDANGKLIEWNTGYFEPEGIRVKDGKVFVNMTVRVGYYDKDGKNAEQRRHYIFVYDLTRGIK